MLLVQRLSQEGQPEKRADRWAWWPALFPVKGTTGASTGSVQTPPSTDRSRELFGSQAWWSRPRSRRGSTRGSWVADRQACGWSRSAVARSARPDTSAPRGARRRARSSCRAVPRRFPTASRRAPAGSTGTRSRLEPPASPGPGRRCGCRTAGRTHRRSSPRRSCRARRPAPATSTPELHTAQAGAHPLAPRGRPALAGRQCGREIGRCLLLRRRHMGHADQPLAEVEDAQECCTAADEGGEHAREPFHAPSLGTDRAGELRTATHSWGVADVGDDGINAILLLP